jgi:hypothetical protein
VISEETFYTRSPSGEYWIHFFGSTIKEFLVGVVPGHSCANQRFRNQLQNSLMGYSPEATVCLNFSYNPLSMTATEGDLLRDAVVRGL